MPVPDVDAEEVEACSEETAAVEAVPEADVDSVDSSCLTCSSNAVGRFVCRCLL